MIQPEFCQTCNLCQIFQFFNYPVLYYTVLDEVADSPGGRSLAAPAPPVLCPAGEIPSAGRRARALAGPVSRAARDRAGAAHSHGAAGRDTRLRRVERHRPRGPARIPVSRAAPPVGLGPPGEVAGSPPHRRSAPPPPVQPRDRPP